MFGFPCGTKALKPCESMAPSQMANWLGLFMLKISNAWGLPRHLTAISLRATHTPVDSVQTFPIHWGGGNGDSSTCVRNHSSMLRPTRRDLRIIKWPTWGNYQQRAGGTHEDISGAMSHPFSWRSPANPICPGTQGKNFWPPFGVSFQRRTNVTSMRNKPGWRWNRGWRTRTQTKTKTEPSSDP